MQTVGFRQSRRSKEAYFLWRVERAVPAVVKIQKLKRLKGKQVLDLGCGYGALTSLLSEKGAVVTATEIDREKLTFAKKKLKNHSAVRFVHVHDETLPFESNTFDLVMLFDVIEHVRDPEKMIREVFRVLKKRGIVYVEFTPFYSVTGHHLYDYTKVPVHLFAERKIKQMIYQKDLGTFVTQDQYWELYQSLNKLKISQFRNMMKETTVREEKYIIKYPNVFSINLPFLRYFGPLTDFFTMSFEGIYQKTVDQL